MQSKWTYGSSPSWGGGSLPCKVSDCMTNHVLGKESLATSGEVEACASLPPDNGFIRLEGGACSPTRSALLTSPSQFPYCLCIAGYCSPNHMVQLNFFKKYKAKDPCNLNWERSKLSTNSLDMKTPSKHRDLAIFSLRDRQAPFL